MAYSLKPTRPRRSHGPAFRIGWFVGRLIVWFLVLSVGVTLLYKVVPVPFTATMLSDPNGFTRDWTPLSAIDRNIVGAVIAGEDGKFCTHDGFDREAIAQAAYRNLKGGRIRGGSTISQQTAKNVFLWQGGGYFRKGLEAWFTLLIEQIWGKRRIMEVYLNVAETGIGTYGVSAGAERYFGHDASALTREQAARLAAVLPLPKGRDAIAPKGFTRRYGNTIASRVGVVARDRLDACVYAGATAPRDRTPPPSRKPVAIPGEDVETATPPPEVLEALPEAPPAAEPQPVPEAEPAPEPVVEPEPEPTEPEPEPTNAL